MLLTALKERPYLLPLGIGLIAILIAHSTMFQQNPQVFSWAIAADLFITSPALYLLLTRPKKASTHTLLLVFTFGILLSLLLLPFDLPQLRDQLPVIAPLLLEVIIAGLTIYLVQKKVRAAIEAQKGSDFLTTLHALADKLLPRVLARLLATELACLYYTLFCWKKVSLQNNEFSYHKKSGTQLIIGTLLTVIAVETFALHLALEQWQPIVAWLATGLSLYSIFQLLALARSMPQLPITIDHQDQSIRFRFGVFARTTVAISDLERIEVTSRQLPQHQTVVPLSPLGSLSCHNLIIHLTNHNMLETMYGGEKTYFSLSVYVDERDEFLRQLEAYNIKVSS